MEVENRVLEDVFRLHDYGRKGILWLIASGKVSAAADIFIPVGGAVGGAALFLGG